MAVGNVGTRERAGVFEFYSKVTGYLLAKFDPASLGKVSIAQRRSVSDIDAQNGTLTAARVATGIIVHTSVTGAGTLTFDTGANYDTQFPDCQVGDVIEFDLFNDGNQTVTLAADAGPTITLWGATQTLATFESAHVILLKTAAGAYTAYWYGA